MVVERTSGVKSYGWRFQVFNVCLLGLIFEPVFSSVKSSYSMLVKHSLLSTGIRKGQNITLSMGPITSNEIQVREAYQEGENFRSVRSYKDGEQRRLRFPHERGLVRKLLTLGDTG